MKTRMMNVLLFLFIAVSATETTNTIGEIRCYCNDVSCVSTSYMCKSSIGACFSHLTNDGSTSVHGCLDFRPEQDHDLCQRYDLDTNDVINDVIHARVQTNGAEEQVFPMLVCCNKDMCNYMEYKDITVYINMISNGTIVQKTIKTDGGSNDPVSVPRGHVPHMPTNALHQKELWFKAAVIAVPIAGGFILVLLVLMAVRLLRNDSQRIRHQLMQYDQQCQHNHYQHPYYQCKQHHLGKAKLYEATIGDDPSTCHVVVGLPPGTLLHPPGRECLVDNNTGCLIAAQSDVFTKQLDDIKDTNVDSPLIKDKEKSKGDVPVTGLATPQPHNVVIDSLKKEGVSSSDKQDITDAASLVTWRDHMTNEAPSIHRQSHGSVV